MRGLYLALIILAIASEGSGCASVHLPSYTLDQETSDTIGAMSVIGEGAYSVGATAYGIDKAVSGHK